MTQKTRNRFTVKTATEKGNCRKGNGKLGNEKIGQWENWTTEERATGKLDNGKMQLTKKGNIYVTAEKSATRNVGNRKMGNGK